MDANKKKKLEDIGYRVLNTCSLCRHSVFSFGSDFGECSQFEYHHLKHDDKRQLSIHRSGSCDCFEHGVRSVDLGAWESFRIRGTRR
jgi:hypothetical protein